ncbi:MAG: Hsp20/alpha crystallin family protein [Candidatus Saccharicenans sp.]|jgi:HSP20 family protein|nr:Hsp20/alpha crystallin family protein [Candidatus Saccharicenans sp.]MDH7494251.1 Hsp20/alpha crystallin family protein [Candidatus Saccharicenans sp.]
MKKKIKPVARVFRVETQIRGSDGELVFKRESLGGLGLAWEPAVDVYEKEDEVVVEVEVPGVPARNLRIVQWGNRLEVSGMKKEVVEAARLKFHRLEREMGFFHKEIVLPVAVSTKDTRASLENGVLTIVLKKQPRTTREIEVKIQKTKAEGQGGE